MSYSCVIFMGHLCVIVMCRAYVHLYVMFTCHLYVLSLCVIIFVIYSLQQDVDKHTQMHYCTHTNVYAHTYIIRRIDCGCWCSIFQCLPLRLSLAKRRSTLHLEMRLPFLARPEVTRHTSDTSTGLVKVVLCPRVSNLTWCFCE